MRRALCFLVLAFAGSAPSTVIGQPPGLRATIVTATVEPETLTVGEPFTVRIRVRAPIIATIRFPSVPDSADAIEAVDPRYVEDAHDKEVLDRTGVYRLVAWDVGTHRPRFANVVVSASGAEQSFPVAVGAVLVMSLLPPDSASRVPKEAREPVPPASMLWRYILLLVLVVGALVWYGWRRLRTRRTAPPVDPEAFGSANTQFAAVDALGLVDAGEPGRHAIAHVDVMRAYFARRFPLALESLTAGELATALRASEASVVPERVGALLVQDADVRFAHAAIAPEQAIAVAREARAIVQDVQQAYEARLKALDKRPARQRRSVKK
jgi:hypothetical protein